MILYPYISKHFKFPVGCSIVHVGDSCKDIEACLRMDGVTKCSIVPTEKLYHRILPFRRNNKLMFACVERAFSLLSVRDVCIFGTRIGPSPVRG